MSAAAPAAPPPTTATPPATPVTVSIPEVSSAPPAQPGAQGVKAAPTGTIPPPVKSLASEKPESAKNKMFSKLRSKAGDQAPTPEAKPAAPSTEQTPEPEAKAAESEEDPMGGVPEEKKAPEAKVDDKTAAAGDKKDKPNPWKMLDERKEVIAKLEQERDSLKKLIPDVEARKREVAEVEKLRARNEELEQHIAFKDYEQSTEFKEKFDQPYKAQWKNSMQELEGVTVMTDDGERQIEAKDLLELVNSPLATARQIANDKFGDFADDVMAQRKAIKDSFEAREGALKEAKKNAADREKQLNEQGQTKHTELVGEIKGTYESATEAIMKDARHAPYLSKRDGDDEGNTLLDKGYEFVDSAFKQSPLDPSLTKEQRASITKKHAAVRHKAAAYNRLVRDLRTKDAALKEALAKLGQYESTVPGRENNHQFQAPVSTKASAGLFSRLRAKAGAPA